jgi:transcriptional regulator with XRE-family HTH domain
VLAWSMQTLRIANGIDAKQVATEFGCSAAHISRVEQGKTKPSRELVQFYENMLEGDGMLLSIFESVIISILAFGTEAAS